MGQTFELNNTSARPKGPPPPIAPSRPGGSTASAPADESGRLNTYRAELDTFRALIVGFDHLDSSEVLGQISGIAGRVAEIRADLVRVNTPRCARLRTSEVDPLRDDLDFQFRIWSRKIALMEWEFKVSGGGI